MLHCKSTQLKFQVNGVPKTGAARNTSAKKCYSSAPLSRHANVISKNIKGRVCRRTKQKSVKIRCLLTSGRTWLRPRNADRLLVRDRGSFRELVRRRRGRRWARQARRRVKRLRGTASAKHTGHPPGALQGVRGGCRPRGVGRAACTRTRDETRKKEDILLAVVHSYDSGTVFSFRHRAASQITVLVVRTHNILSTGM